jgi:hypothetical protein
MDLQANLQNVRAKFLARDFELLSFRAHERTVAHRIAVYLEEEFPNWHVDCEYNRQGIGEDPKDDWVGRRRFPDIIVHQRGLADNLLVIEAKPAWASTKCKEVDRKKLRAIAKKYGYKFAYVLSYSSGANPDLWFKSEK